MSFSAQSAIRLSRESLLMRFYRACERYTNNRSTSDQIDLCTLGRTFLVAGFKVLGACVNILFSIMCTLLWVGLLAGSFLGLIENYGGNIAYAVGALLGIIAASIAVFLALVWVIMKARSAYVSFDLRRKRRKGGWRPVVKSAPKPASDSLFKIVGQWLYDRFHGICRKIEIV